MKNVFKKAVSLTVALSTVAALSVSAFAAANVSQEDDEIVVSVNDAYDAVSVNTTDTSKPYYSTIGEGQYAVAVVLADDTTYTDEDIYYVNQADEATIDDIISNMLVKGALSENVPYEVRIGTNATVDPDEVALTVIPFTIKANTILYGDVNGDTRVSRPDLTLLARYFGRLESKDSLAAGADVNGDTNVSRPDLTLLARYFGRLESTLGPSTQK